MKDCVFCRILGGEIPATRLYEDDATVAFRDVNPAAPAHALVVPRKHIATLDDATTGDRELLGKMIWAARASGRRDGSIEVGLSIGNEHARGRRTVGISYSCSRARRSRVRVAAGLAN